MKSHNLEQSKIEMANLPIGELATITLPYVVQNYGLGTYGEIYCADPFKLRIHRSCERAIGVGRVPYKGVLSSPLQKNDEGFKRFSEITEKLESLFGKSIPHEVEDYVAALSNGLGVSLYTDHSNFFIRPEGGLPFPRFLHSGKDRINRLFSSKLQGKGFLMGKIIEEHQKYEGAKKSIGNLDKCKKIGRKLEDYFDCFREICDEGRWYQGMILEYEEHDPQNVFDFFNYVLGEGVIPDLPNAKPTETTSSQEETSIETEPSETTIINPWGIEIPQIE